ncbi:hypothetical protein LTR15_010939 [Elasticomyces elasticus]|nr:hypothetical protein LTR15_010939 [Elasticomyces elasticus]
MTIRYITQPAVPANTNGTHDNPTTRSNTPVLVTRQSVSPPMQKRYFEVMQKQEARNVEMRTTTVHPLKKRSRRNTQSQGNTQKQTSTTQNKMVFSQITLKAFIVTITILSAIVMFAGLEALDCWSGLNATGKTYGMAALVLVCVWLPCDVAMDLVKLGRKGAKAGKRRV